MYENFRLFAAWNHLTERCQKRWHMWKGTLFPATSSTCLADGVHDLQHINPIWQGQENNLTAGERENLRKGEKTYDGGLEPDTHTRAHTHGHICPGGSKKCQETNAIMSLTNRKWKYSVKQESLFQHHVPQTLYWSKWSSLTVPTGTETLLPPPSHPFSLTPIFTSLSTAYIT